MQVVTLISLLQAIPELESFIVLGTDKTVPLLRINREDVLQVLRALTGCPRLHTLVLEECFDPCYSIGKML